MRFLQSYPTRVRKILTLIIVTVFLTNTIAPSAIFAQNFKTRPKTQMVRAESRQLSDCQTVRPSDRQTVRPFNSQLLKDQYLQSMEKLKNSSSADAELSAQTEEMLDLVKNRLFLSGPYEKTAVSSESRQGGTLSYRQKYLKESSQPKAHSPEQDFTSSKHKAQSKPLYIFGAYQGDLSRIYFVMKYQGYAVSHEPWALSYRQKYLKESSQSRLGGTQSKPFDTLRLAPGSVEFETRLQLTLELLGGALAGMGQQPIRIYTGSEAYRLLQSHEWQLASNVRNFSGPAKAGQARSKSLTLPFTDHLSLATDHLLEIFIPQSELTPQIQSQSITFNIKQLPPLSPLPPLPHLLSLKILRDHGFIPTFAEEMRRLHYSAEQLLAHLKHHGYRIGYICANQAVNLCRSVFYLERELPGGMMRSNNNNNNNNVNTNNANSAGTIFQQALSALKEGSLHKAIEILSQEVSGASDYPQALREAAQEIRQNEKLQKMLMEIVLSSREDNQSPTSKVQRQ